MSLREHTEPVKKLFTTVLIVGQVIAILRGGNPEPPILLAPPSPLGMTMANREGGRMRAWRAAPF